MRISIAKSITAIVCLLASVSTPAFAEDKQADGMALVKRGVELTDLSKSGPYRLHNILTLSDDVLDKQLSGEEVIYFVSPEQWRRELRIKDYYDESAYFIGQNMYRGRSLTFTPPAGRKDVAARLRSLPELLEYKVLRVYEREVNGSTTNCVYLQERGERKNEQTWCFDPKSGLPLAVYFRDQRDFIEFHEYKPFGQQFVPGTIEVFVGGKSKDKAVIEIVAGVPKDPKTFQPPAAFPARPWCDNTKSFLISSFDRPEIPQGARSHTGWELFYEVTIDAQGRVTNVVPMSPKPFADRIVMETAKGWKFKPALCGATPVPTDFMVNVQ